jgi:hypothetical protein
MLTLPKNLRVNSTGFVNSTKYRLMTAPLPKHPEPPENQKRKRRRADPKKVSYGKF